jgi:uncharacterized protein (DUF1499 family)
MPSVDVTDFATLQRPPSPNTWLVAPNGLVPDAPDEIAPVFDVSAERLAAVWSEVLREQPRTAVVVVTGDGLGIEAEQRSRVFRFVDRVSVRILPLPGGRATFAAFSRSLVGYYDFGVNRSRLRAWIGEVRARLTKPA